MERCTDIDQSLEIPEVFPFEGKFTRDRLDLEEFDKEYKEREKWLKVGMFAFVCKQWTRPLAKWIGERKVLEVMAGAGWLSKALREEGVDIIATDNRSWHTTHKTVTEVVEMDAVKAVKKFSDRQVVIMSWPPYLDLAAYQVLKFMNPNSTLVYIGEGYGGCTADDKFHQHYEELNDPTFEPVSSMFRNFKGLHDQISLGKFKIKT